MAIEGAWVLSPRVHGDDRGRFLEWYTEGAVAALDGHPLSLAQANCSVSAPGVLRGVHTAQVPPGQAKYVTCPVGAVLDVVVDLRLGSPTFGAWDSVVLDDVDHRAVYLSEGLGHAFLALDHSTVVYLCSQGYAPGREFGVSPTDPDLGIVWPSSARDGSPLTLVLSEKDDAAPSLRDVARSGRLPTYDDVLAYRSSLHRADAAS